MKSILKLKIVLITSLISISNSHAESDCYLPMRSLNLSVNSGVKKVCEQEIEAESSNLEDKEPQENLEDSSVGVEAYFVYPHMENKEEEPTADGIGANISVGF